MVSTARSQAEIKTYEQLQIFLTPERRQFFDDLLTVDEEIGRTGLTWLQRTPQSNRAAAIVGTLDKRLDQRDITDVLIEVDNWTGFSDAFIHLDGVAIRDRALLSQRAKQLSIESS
jgi:hypothetical protein